MMAQEGWQRQRPQCSWEASKPKTMFLVDPRPPRGHFHAGGDEAWIHLPITALFSLDKGTVHIAI